MAIKISGTTVIDDNRNFVNADASTANTFTDKIGEVRNVPINTQAVAYTLAANDAGKFISTSANVAVPAGVFSAGNTVAVYNNSASNIFLTQGAGVTMYSIGTATTGNRTLAQRAIATVFCVGANTFVAGGGGVT